MALESENNIHHSVSLKKPIFVTITGLVILITLIITTTEIGKRNIIAFVSADQKYILSIEITILVIFFIEAVVKFVVMWSNHTEVALHSASWRLIVRIVGYSLGSVSVISILASNTTLGISVGAIAGVVIAFATQNIASSVLAAILVISTGMIKIGEEITISGTTGTVTGITLTHTVITVGDDVVLIPNSFLMANLVRRKKRNSGGSGVSI
jgi:small-conductance mechanosensitive channel